MLSDSWLEEEEQEEEKVEQATDVKWLSSFISRSHMGSCPSKSWFWGSTFTHNWLIFCIAHTHTHAQLQLATSAIYLHRSHNYLAITHMCARLLVRVLAPSPSVSLSVSPGNYCCLSVLIKMCVCLAGLESFQCQQIICVCHKCRPHRLKRLPQHNLWSLYATK